MQTIKQKQYEEPTTAPARQPGLVGAIGQAANQIKDAAAQAAATGAKAAESAATAAANDYAANPAPSGDTTATEQAIYNAAAAQAVPVSAAGTAVPTAPATSTAAATTAAPAYTAPDYTAQINDIYDKALAAQRAQLDSGYEATMRELEAAAARLPETYQQRANDLNAQYERQRAALNEQMAANGLNIGAGSQARLAQNAGYQSAYGQIQAAQANAQAALEQQRVAKEAEYQAAITQALRDNDYQRAVALAQEMRDQRNADLDRAKTLAGYGDFSGYEALYGTDAAKNMRDVWLAQNPQFAYMTGNLTAEQYRQLTGQYPADAQPQVSYAYTSAASTGDTDKGTDGTTREVPRYENSGTGMDARSFGYLQQSFGSARTRAEALALLNRMDAATQNSLSDQQKAQLVSIINAKG